MLKLAATATAGISAASAISLKWFKDVNKTNRKKLNRRKKVNVIGAGIVGVTTARMMRNAGHEVVLIDSELPGTQCSGANGCTMGVNRVESLATLSTLLSTRKWITRSYASSINDNRFVDKKIFRDPHF